MRLVTGANASAMTLGGLSTGAPWRALYQSRPACHRPGCGGLTSLLVLSASAVRSVIKDKQRELEMLTDDRVALLEQRIRDLEDIIRCRAWSICLLDCFACHVRKRLTAGALRNVLCAA